MLTEICMWGFLNVQIQGHKIYIILVRVFLLSLPVCYAAGQAPSNDCCVQPRHNVTVVNY